MSKPNDWADYSGGMVTSLASEDAFLVQDVSDTTESDAGTTKGATIGQLLNIVTVGAPAADAITITDVGGYYTGTTVEAALQELPDHYAPLPAVVGTVGQALKISSLSPLVAEWGDVSSSSSTGIDGGGAASVFGGTEPIDGGSA